MKRVPYTCDYIDSVLGKVNSIKSELNNEEIDTFEIQTLLWNMEEELEDLRGMNRDLRDNAEELEEQVSNVECERDGFETDMLRYKKESEQFENELCEADALIKEYQEMYPVKVLFFIRKVAANIYAFNKKLQRVLTFEYLEEMNKRYCSRS